MRLYSDFCGRQIQEHLKLIQCLLSVKTFGIIFLEGPKGGLGGGSQGLEPHFGQDLRLVHLCWHIGDCPHHYENKNDWLVQTRSSKGLNYEGFYWVSSSWLRAQFEECDFSTDEWYCQRWRQRPFLWWFAQSILTNHMPKCNWTGCFEQQLRVLPLQWKRLSTYFAELHASTVWTQNIHSPDRGKSGKHLFLQG